MLLYPQVGGTRASSQLERRERALMGYRSFVSGEELMVVFAVRCNCRQLKRVGRICLEFFVVEIFVEFFVFEFCVPIERGYTP